MTDRERALLSLCGLSVGDALGERFFGPPARVLQWIAARELPRAPWRWTDDTQMALSVTEELLEDGHLDPDRLALRFARRYDPERGYGSGAHRLLQAIGAGMPWRLAASSLFGGEGSYGNGGAMRVAPLGAFFADDLDAAVAAAADSARVTHAHPEGIAGTIALAVAAAVAWRQGAAGTLDGRALLDEVLARTPAGETADGLRTAAQLDPNTSPEVAAERLGSGQRVSSQDTVPFALWCSARHLDSFEEAFWHTVQGLGDRDTTCAMVGGIVALSARRVPEAWINAREAIPAHLVLSEDL
jgi:ADP-ribosylglycohydrolase